MSVWSGAPSQDIIVDASLTTVAGALSATFNDFTAAATGEILSAGTLSAAFSDFTLAGSGVPLPDGSLAVTFADFTLAGAAAVLAAGNLAATFADFTLAGTGTVLAAGALSSTFDDFTLVGTGSVLPVVLGNLAVTFADFSLLSTGEPLTVGSLSATISDFTLVGIGAVVSPVAIVGSLSSMFDDFALSAAGEAIPPPFTPPNGRWRFLTLYPVTLGYPSIDLPAVGEVGFTVFFCDPTDPYPGSHIVFVKPSGEVFETNPSLNYLAVIPSLQPSFNFPVVCYTFGPGEIDEIGVWQVYLKRTFETSGSLPMVVTG